MHADGGLPTGSGGVRGVTRWGTPLAQSWKTRKQCVRAAFCVLRVSLTSPQGGAPPRDGGSAGATQTLLPLFLPDLCSNRVWGSIRPKGEVFHSRSHTAQPRVCGLGGQNRYQRVPPPPNPCLDQVLSPGMPLPISPDDKEEGGSSVRPHSGVRKDVVATVPAHLQPVLEIVLKAR